MYYAGPAKTPEGYASGSFGPTTAGRMDSYVDQFQAAGGSMVMLAKGNRSRQVTESCREHGGFYLGSIGGAAARLALDNIKQVDVLEYPELGMEAVWKIEVVDFPAFIVVDDKGNDFFEQVKTEAAAATSVSLASPSAANGWRRWHPVIIGVITDVRTEQFVISCRSRSSGRCWDRRWASMAGRSSRSSPPRTSDSARPRSASPSASACCRCRSRSGPHGCRCGGPGAISRPFS